MHDATMIEHLVGVERPQRWAVPFDVGMTDADVDQILQAPPFRQLDPARFPAALPLRGILHNDARLWRCRPGDIIVRAGDYLNSAYFILSGSCRLEMEPAATRLSDEVLGRRKPQKKGLFKLLAQLWNPRSPEVRDPATYRPDPRVGSRAGDHAPRIFLQDVQSVLDSRRTARLDAGQSFGETAALSRTPREFTVFAETDAVLVEVRWQGLRDLMRRDEGLRRHAEQTFRERALKAFLANSPLLAHLSPDDLDAVAKEVLFESYGSYDEVGRFHDTPPDQYAARLAKEPLIAEEGQYVNGLYLVRNGLVRICVKHQHGQRTVGYLTAGQAYGFDELSAAAGDTTPEMRRSLRAAGYVNLVLVPAPVVQKYILGRKRAAPRTHAAPPVAPEMLEFLIENRFVNGSATMMIDLDRCTRCDDCVRACATAHGNNPRFLRNGPTYGHYMVANACLHCQNPVCMIECPTGAIHRDLTGGMVVVNDATCIGCGACASNCPYNAIRMVEVHDPQGLPIVDAATNVPVVKATKCDLCVDQWGGPACQRACPHDALQRVDMRDQDLLSHWLNR